MAISSCFLNSSVLGLGKPAKHFGFFQNFINLYQFHCFFHVFSTKLAKYPAVFPLLIPTDTNRFHIFPQKHTETTVGFPTYLTPNMCFLRFWNTPQLTRSTLRGPFFRPKFVEHFHNFGCQNAQILAKG